MSRQIHIGNLTLGGGAPVRVQSMTNTDTMDTHATVELALRMVEAGCELVRITAPDVKAAENLGRIKDELLKRGCEVPLVADIHFNPKAAEVAATLVEKVRVNPGNYTDRNTGKLEFTEQEYNDELKRIGERMSTL
ncbi:MAG: flavodoxin-dependent (E)-4-hydroxy-3-methylbut-2-enyl-diphosphate synthase, partial [Bacteroidales bacterium]|nr:flavodoxin-dependent (E)-4-hydroxy-3-methylbut-2-enyl-diphosphate synthase [Bacteroidales bacterium]